MSEKPQIFINPKSGSIRISGDVEFIDADGVLIRSESNVKLCGCGHSKDKPYCDGSHKEFRQEKNSDHDGQG
jgi:2-oxopent-4-enoate/cis-2-oxohex-4-enoate hydratase